MSHPSPLSPEIEFKHRCPNCGQIVPTIRYGVRFSLRRGIIIDMVINHPGIKGPEIATRLGCTDATIKQHIWQINNCLEESESNRRIRGTIVGGYRVIEVAP